MAKTTQNKILWTIQTVLALMFLFAGGMKLVVPIEALAANPMGLSGGFLRFIGLAEVAGALGLILPGLLRIRRGLTPLAAAGLAIIMVGATVLNFTGGAGVAALIPLALCGLAVLVVRGRARFAW